MGYNLAITVPTVLGFIKEATVIRNKYLEQSFSKLSTQELSNLSLKVKNVKYKKGERVFSQGDIADKCFVITKGKADVILEQENSPELYLATLSAGQIFGEIGLLDDEAKLRTASIAAKTALECLEIDKETFADLMDSETGEFRSDDTKKELLKLANIRLEDIDRQGHLGDS
jgi:CRP-like cAMP-binding protein